MNIFSKKRVWDIDVVVCSKSSFKGFLDNIYGQYCYDFNYYCDDLEKKLQITGDLVYELHKDFRDPDCFQCDEKKIQWIGSKDDFENASYPSFLWVE